MSARPAPPGPGDAPAPGMLRPRSRPDALRSPRLGAASRGLFQAGEGGSFCCSPGEGGGGGRGGVVRHRTGAQNTGSPPPPGPSAPPPPAGPGLLRLRHRIDFSKPWMWGGGHQPSPPPSPEPRGGGSGAGLCVPAAGADTASPGQRPGRGKKKETPRKSGKGRK